MKTDKDNKGTFIEIKEGTVSYGYYIYKGIEEENGYMSFYIPAYDIYFSAQTHEIGEKRAEIMVKSFYDFWLDQQGWKGFVLQIHKLGFRAKNHDLVMKTLLHKRALNTKFSSPNAFVPEGFDAKSAHAVTSEIAIWLLEVDTHLFLEIILSEGVMLLYVHKIEEEVIEYYHGINGKKVAICVTDEYLTTKTAKNHLRQLGLDSLIPRLFPQWKMGDYIRVAAKKQN